MRQFEEQKIKPAASSVSKRQTGQSAEDGIKKTKSLFSQRRAKNTENHVVKENVKIKFELPDKPTDLQTENEHSAKDNILNEIVEKNTSGKIKVNLPSLLNDSSTSKHFPNAMKIPSFKPNLATTSVKNNKSLFAQQFQHMKRDMAEM